MGREFQFPSIIFLFRGSAHHEDASLDQHHVTDESIENFLSCRGLLIFITENHILVIPVFHVLSDVVDFDI